MKSSILKKCTSTLLVLIIASWVSPICAFEDTEDDVTNEFADSENEFEEDSDVRLSAKGLELSGFLEIEQGGHIGKRGAQDRDWVMENKRIRLKTSGNSEAGKYFLKFDIVNDGVEKKQEVEIREARLLFSPLEWVDVSAGTQVSTWGVSDMLYINDLFPKNWVANFLGRDTEALKESSNSIRVTSYFGISSGIDMVYHPDFTPDITPTGCRFSIYDPNTDSLIQNTDKCGEDFSTSQQTGEYSHGEFATRWFYKSGSHEFALYTYTGYFKNPKGQQWIDSDEDATGNTDYLQTNGYTKRMSYYPKLNVYGLSAEGQLGPGIYSFETGYYDSREDRNGDNPFIENPFWKILTGYKMDVDAHLTIGVQWYAEIMEKYSSYEKSIISMLKHFHSITGEQAKNQDAYKYRKKHLQNTYTLRLTYKTMQERLWINFFGYHRPQDHDAFYKLDTNYQLDNNIYVIAGLNIFEGSDNYKSRDFGMLKKDDNAFIRLKYTF